MAKKILIVLDPGHYPKYNKGVVGGYYEGDKMYTLTEYEKTALEAYGFKVIITRKRANDMDLYARGQVAVKNGKGYDSVVFISNHSNASDNSSANGSEVFGSLYLPDSEKLAVKLLTAVESTMDAVTGLTSNSYRGVKTRQGNNGDYYGVIRGAVSGATSTAKAKKGVVDFAFIIEHGFHTNKKECSFLADDANLKKLAEAKAKVLAEYFGMVSVTKTEGDDEVYRVRKSWAKESTQLGAYKSLTNAKKKADENPGYYVFNDEGKKVYPTKSTYKGTFPTLPSRGYLKTGGEGTAVKNLQKFLNWYGNYGLKVDGAYGAKTKDAVEKFQKAEGLTVDGCFGKKSLAKAKVVKR